MLDDFFAIDIYHKLGYSISGISKSTTHAGHGNNNFHDKFMSILKFSGESFV